VIVRCHTHLFWLFLNKICLRWGKSSSWLLGATHSSCCLRGHALNGILYQGAPAIGSLQVWPEDCSSCSGRVHVEEVGNTLHIDVYRWECKWGSSAGVKIPRVTSLIIGEVTVAEMGRLSSRAGTQLEGCLSTVKFIILSHRELTKVPNRTGLKLSMRLRSSREKYPCQIRVYRFLSTAGFSKIHSDLFCIYKLYGILSLQQVAFVNLLNIWFNHFQNAIDDLVNWNFF